MSFLRALSRRTKSKVDDVIIDSLQPSLSIILFIVFVWVGLYLLPLDFTPAAENVIQNAGRTVIVLAAALGITRLLRGLLQLPAERQARWLPASLIGSRVISIVIFLVAFLIVLKQYGIEITPILTTLGIAGIAVALALQDTLANIFAGIWVQTQRSLRPGHYIRLEDQKLEGFVGEVGWRTTKLRTLNGNLIELPNSVVAQNVITDYFQPESKMGTSILVVTGFEADPDRVVPMLLEEAHRAAQEVKIILPQPSPAARLNRAVEYGWEFNLGFWVPNYYNQWDAQGEMLNRVRKRFLQEGIRIPYPIRETFAVPKERADVYESVAAVRSGNGVQTIQTPAKRPSGLTDEEPAPEPEG